MRYRKGLVNRKVKTAVLELLYVTADSTRIERGTFEVIAHTGKTDALVREVRKKYVDIKYVIKLVRLEIRETLYYMTDEEFIKNAHKEDET